MALSKFYAAVIGLTALVFAGNANAVIINFTGINSGCNYSEAGYNFNCTGNHTDASDMLAWHDGGFNPGDNDIILTRADGAAFDILSLQTWSNNFFSIITTAGTFTNPGVGTGIPVNLLGVFSATFEAGNSLAKVDNIELAQSIVPSAVSEPGTLAFFGLGLAGLGYSRRRKLA